MTEQTEKKKKTLHHIAVGVGFAGLILWYYAGYKLGFLDWAIQQVPQKYAGSGLMIAIMVMMTPGFFLWKLYNRWIEKRLNITGIYYEDEYYKRDQELKEQKQREKENAKK